MCENTQVLLFDLEGFKNYVVGPFQRHVCDQKKVENFTFE